MFHVIVCFEFLCRQRLWAWGAAEEVLGVGRGPGGLRGPGVSSASVTSLIRRPGGDGGGGGGSEQETREEQVRQYASNLWSVDRLYEGQVTEWASMTWRGRQHGP